MKLFRVPAKPFRRLLRTLVLAWAAMAPLRAQEVSAALGRLHSIEQGGITYSWQAQYFQSFSPTWAGSFTWLNEGHLLDHHRDGAVVQLWRFHRMEKNDLRLGLGLGPYRYFDTTNTGQGGAMDYHNGHGFKPLLSLRAQYPIRHTWDALVQLNRTLGPTSDQTQAFMVGISTRFGSATPQSRRDSSGWNPDGTDGEAKNELSLLFGSTILNSFESETTGLFDAFALQYRRRLTQHFDVSVEYSDEGSIDHAKRDGAAVQAWITARSPERGWLLGFGVGPYFNRVFPDQQALSADSTVNTRTSLRYSLLAGRHLWGHWAGRLQWNRTLTRYDRDTDMLLVGLAYPW